MVLMCQYCKKPCSIKQINNSQTSEPEFSYVSECCWDSMVELSVCEDPEDYHEEIPSQERLQELWEREGESLMDFNDYEGEDR